MQITLPDFLYLTYTDKNNNADDTKPRKHIELEIII